MITDTDKHLTDQEFFTHIKFFNLIFEKGIVENDSEDEENTFRLSDIGLGDDEEGYIFNRIFLGGQLLEIPVTIEKDEGFSEKISEVKKEAEKKPLKEKESLLKTIKDIEEGKKIKLGEVGSLSWIWYGIYENIIFTPSEYEIPKEIEQIFRIETDKYLDNFTNDKLAIVKKNYFKFEKQKEILIKLIEEDKKIKLYGNNFIIREKMNKNCVLDRASDFCIVQTVYALQKLGYLKVINVWSEISYPEGGPYFEGRESRFINVNIILESIFIDEINNNYKKENPKNILEKFDAKRGVLKFAGQEIELSKKGKETDAVLLLKTLLEAKGDEWKHNDEILSDWGYTEADLEHVPKNKVYFAGQKVNTAVALKTKIDDFLECNTTKARINPKYRKVDE